MARTDASADSASKVAASACHMAKVMAFFFRGRLMRTEATLSATFTIKGSFSIAG